MNDAEQLLQRQARWQQSRRALSWPEKIRLAESMRPALLAFRLQRERRLATGPSRDAALGGGADPHARDERA
jgi:hypothetical protein